MKPISMSPAETTPEITPATTPATEFPRRFDSATPSEWLSFRLTAKDADWLEDTINAFGSLGEEERPYAIMSIQRRMQGTELMVDDYPDGWTLTLGNKQIARLPFK